MAPLARERRLLSRSPIPSPGAVAIMPRDTIRVFFNSRYCSQLQYKRLADECQLFLTVSTTSAGKTARSFSSLCNNEVSLNSFKRLADSGSKYPCGMEG